MKKKILYILPYLDKGGTETHVLELIRGFNDKYELILLAPRGPRLPEFEKYDLRYYPFTQLNLNLIKGLKEFKDQLMTIKRLNPELIHIHAAHELILLTRFFIKDIPIIFTVHGYHGGFYKLNYKLSSFINNILAKEVITVSKAEKKLLLNTGIKEKKLNLIYNGVSIPGTDAKNMNIATKKSKLIIGTVARLERVKGINYLIKAFKKIYKPGLHLLINGSGSEEENLKEIVRKLAIEDNVSFTGYVNNVHDYFNIMDIFVLPSLLEPFGLVCVEAMAHKLPVIASETGGIPEIVEDKISGFIVPPGDSSTLATKIETLIQDSNLRKRMGEAGYLRFKNYFNIDIMINKTEMVYLNYL
jgi:L-malate glycosyltransferase